EATERILRKAERLRDAHIVHISSTFYGGGVSEILTPLTLLLNDMHIETGWRMIQGTPAFFSCTKKLHNGLQGDIVELSPEEKEVYEQVTSEAAIFGLLGACFGLELVHEQDEIRFRDPVMPDFLDEVIIRNLRLAQSRADVRIHRFGQDVTANVLARRGS